jgi:hypothetical protein
VVESFYILVIVIVIVASPGGRKIYIAYPRDKSFLSGPFREVVDPSLLVRVIYFEAANQKLDRGVEKHGHFTLIGCSIIGKKVLHNLLRYDLIVLVKKRRGGKSQVGWHDDLFSRMDIFPAPKTGNSLLLCVECQPRLSIKRICATPRNALLVPSEGEHRERNWNCNIYTDLSCLDILLEVRGRRARLGKNRCTVTILICVEKANGFF